MPGREAPKPISATGAAASNVEFAAELAKQRSEVRASAPSGGVQSGRPIRELGGVQFIPGRCVKRPFKRADESQPSRDPNETEAKDGEGEDADDEAARLRASRLGLIAKAALYESLAKRKLGGDDGDEEEPDGEVDDDGPLVDFVRQRQLERWHELDQLNAESNTTHYSRVEYDEAREHGVGYFRFSVDADERAEQLAALNKRTEQTEAAKRRRLEALEKRRGAADARLERIRQRRGIAAPSAAGAETVEDAEEQQQQQPTQEEIERNIDLGLREIRRQAEAEAAAAAASSKSPSFPWQRHQPQRAGFAANRLGPAEAERNPEFAPPY